ncbi:MAG: DUF4145 domain-containing protein [Candidatus Binatus sp.]|uniref:DUF4145 domain-containing protein n=1 Tax=Candidatus Binatus sp. TaxID=2811406 RepID=UPI00272043EE|nr:DUF4145 domain-containing protein [Candidatus Binatus sp.]MDO8433833.1 DUF4145 domain-containing protein [Candidatus Binatus sp.]
MKCPYCNHDIPELWQPLFRAADGLGKPLEKPADYIGVQTNPDDFHRNQVVSVTLKWMQCPNVDCHQILVHVLRNQKTGIESWDAKKRELYFAVPRKIAPRALDPLVQDPFRRDYLEAASILGDSPRMSAILSRRILADLLAAFAGRTEYKLEDRIDNFIADTQFPSNLKDNLHHLREIGNFGAHTKKDKATGEIIDVDREEAEWTLEVVDGLFDYFIVSPEKDKERRAKWDAKRGSTGAKRQTRKPT